MEDDGEAAIVARAVCCLVELRLVPGCAERDAKSVADLKVLLAVAAAPKVDRAPLVRLPAAVMDQALACCDARSLARLASVSRFFGGGQRSLVEQAATSHARCWGNTTEQLARREHSMTTNERLRATLRIMRRVQCNA